MTIFLGAVGTLYAVSFCFVGVLLARTFWRERSTPLDANASVVTLERNTPLPAPDVDVERAPIAALQAAPKSA